MALASFECSEFVKNSHCHITSKVVFSNAQSNAKLKNMTHKSIEIAIVTGLSIACVVFFFDGIFFLQSTNQKPSPLR